MLSKKNQNTGEDRQSLILISAGGVFLLLVLLAALAANMATAGSRELLNELNRSAAGVFSHSMRPSLEAQAQMMSLPIEAGSQAFWYIARAGGVVAYLLLWLATCWGIIMSSKVLKGYVNAPVTYALHEFLPILGIVFAAVHALVLLGDSYIGFSLWQLLVPFSSSYEPFWTGLGSLAFYLFLALVLSSYLRKYIGQKSWRAFHYLSYLAFLLALTHGLMAGSDSGAVSMRALYLVTGGISLFLVYYRMLSYAPRISRRRSESAPERETHRPGGLAG
jgi:DMSO/TMAO reductase YedYZ heme-binding membrane subunit